MMKRIPAHFGLLLFTLTTAGCGSGLQEGSPPEPVKSSQTTEFKALMEKAGGKMQGRRATPKTPPAAAAPAAAAPASSEPAKTP